MKKIKKPIIVAIIPARAGSKGLPGKNIYPVLGHPMIAWSVRAAVECSRVTHTFVISDSADIREVASRYGAEVIVEPKNLGKDDVSYRPVMAYAVKHIRGLGIKPDILVYIQPTSPQRSAKDISRALGLLDGSGVDATMSVYETDNKFLKSFLTHNGGILKPLSVEPWPFMLRTRLPKTYMPNGAIYAIRAKIYDRVKGLFAPRTVPYVMPSERSIDIDDKNHLLQAVSQMRKDHRVLRKK